MNNNSIRVQKSHYYVGLRAWIELKPTPNLVPTGQEWRLAGGEKKIQNAVKLGRSFEPLFDNGSIASRKLKNQ